MSDLTKVEIALGQRDAIERDNIYLGQRLEYAEERNTRLVAALDAMTKERDTWKGLAQASILAARDFANQQSTENP